MMNNLLRTDPVEFVTPSLSPHADDSVTHRSFGSTKRPVRRLVLATNAVVVAFAVAVIAFATACNQSERDPAAAHATATERAEFNVAGMHCATCPITVKAAAKRVAGVRSVRVSLDEAKTWVTFDPVRTTVDAIAKAITEAGYEATPVATP